MNVITLEALETLANQIIDESTEEKEKLARMIRAFARILAAREPKRFKALATVYADEDGHYDNSYPPAIEYKERTGPRAIRLNAFEWTDRATSGGFYHDSKYYTIDPGLYVDREGDLLGADLTGTGSYGQFAAHPGPCSVDCTITYDELDLDDIPFERLKDAERMLRDLAFPFLAARGVS